MSIIESMATLRTIGSHSASGLSQQARAMLAGEPFADRLQIIARIEPLRDRADILAQRLAVAQEGRAGEDVDLRARIVDVVFAGHLVAGEGQELSERVAEHRAAAVAHMHRAGRVGGDEFHVHRHARALPAAGRSRPIDDGRPQDLCRTLGFSLRLMKPGPGDLDLRPRADLRPDRRR